MLHPIFLNLTLATLAPKSQLRYSLEEYSPKKQSVRTMEKVSKAVHQLAGRVFLLDGRQGWLTCHQGEHLAQHYYKH